MKLDLPTTDTEHPPLFTNLDQCQAWLKTLPLTNPVQSQAQLLRQIHLLNRYSLAGDIRLTLLEAVREAVHFVQAESARKFSGKPLPLAPPEQAALDSTHTLWRALASGYSRCLETCLAGEAKLKAQTALLCQRALAALADDQTDLIRAGLQPDGEHWRLAHTLYACAEDLKVATTACEDGLRTTQPISPATTYAELMLLHAANLHELSTRQQTWVMRWARRWASKITLQATPPALNSPALPLCVDLTGCAPAGFMPFTGAGARWLETTELRKSLKKRLTLLAKGDADNPNNADSSPAKLGLGDDCPQPACGEALRRVYPRWVKGGILRRHERHPMSGPCRFVVGVDAIHYYLAGHQPFKPPGSASTDELRRQREELATFGRIADRFEVEYSRTHGYQLENWEVVEDWGMLDQSTVGLRLARPLKQNGGRLGVGQLLAVQPEGSSGLLLGIVRWAQVTGDQLTTGIQLFPGKPTPIGVRGTRAGTIQDKDKYTPGFLLPALAALKLPASIILAPGSFKTGRIMETWTATTTRQVKLKAILDRGADFERVACEDAA